MGRAWASLTLIKSTGAVSIYIYIYGDTTHHSVNSAYNSYYTKRKFSYYSVDKERLRNSREADRWRKKTETSEQRDEHLKRHREADKRGKEAKTPEKHRARLDRQKAYHEKWRLLKQRSREWKDWCRKEAVSSKKLSSETED